MCYINNIVKTKTKGGKKMIKINSLGEAIQVYKTHQIIDLESNLGKELLNWFKASSYSLKYYNKCAFVPALDNNFNI